MRGMRRWWHLAAVGTLGLLAGLIYGPTLSFPFVYDDIWFIVDNPSIRRTHLDVSSLQAIELGRSQRRWVSALSFALTYYGWGYDVRAFRAVNIAIHALNGWLVYAIVWSLLARLGARPHGAAPSPWRLQASTWIAAAVFVAHPVQTQAVTYVCQRMTSQAAAFYLGAFWLFLCGASADAPWRRFACWSGAWLSWILALGSKEIALPFLVAIALYEWCAVGEARGRWLRRHAPVLGALALGLGGVVAVYVAGDGWDEAWGRLGFSMRERVLTEFRVVTFYAGLLLFPAPGRLNLLHPFAVSHALLDPPTTLASALGILAVIGTGLWAVRWWPLAAFGLLWIPLHLAIESSILPIHLVFEHRLYLPMMGVAVLCGAVLMRLPHRWWPLGMCGGVLLVIMLGTAAFVRNGVWRDELTLWSDVLAKNPQSDQAHDELGLALLKRGAAEAAIAEFTAAARLNPRNWKPLYNLGNALAAVGRLEEARARFADALRLNARSERIHHNLAAVALRTGRPDEALAHFRAAVQIDPTYPEAAHAHYGAAWVLRRQGRTEEAKSALTEALRLKPDYREARRDLEQLRGPAGPTNQ
jgi:Tfp pilus assembly protein PilF